VFFRRRHITLHISRPLLIITNMLKVTELVAAAAPRAHAVSVAPETRRSDYIVRQSYLNCCAPELLPQCSNTASSPASLLPQASLRYRRHCSSWCSRVAAARVAYRICTYAVSATLAASACGICTHAERGLLSKLHACAIEVAAAVCGIQKLADLRKPRGICNLAASASHAASAKHAASDGWFGQQRARVNGAPFLATMMSSLPSAAWTRGRRSAAALLLPWSTAVVVRPTRWRQCTVCGHGVTLLG
jgi:hypothetical protein